MPLYVWTITFEADDRDDAERQVYESAPGEVDGAIHAFDSVVRERLAEGSTE